jgi:hypothetical protein
MRVQVVFVLIVLVLLAGFAALNWAALAASAPVHLLVARVEAPLGLLLLGVAAALTVLYLLLAVGIQTAALLEARRAARDLLAQRKLADDAEASRFTALQSYLERELAELRPAPAEAARPVLERIAQSEEALRRDIEAAGNTLAAYIGEVEDRLTRGAPRDVPGA